MKKKMIIALGVLLVFGFSSFPCYAQSSNNDQRIVGTWVSEGNTLTFVFNANGTGTFTASRGSVNFSYAVSIDGELKMVGGVSGTSKIYFSPDGRIMLMGTGDDVFQKK